MLTLLLLTACAEVPPEDTDGDGLSVEEEEDLGTDPELSDTDGDGIDDGDEVDLGTDPLALDTDEDTYWDSWELAEGTDPLDPDSRIYIGYWPYNPDKDQMVDPGWEQPAEEGELAPHFVSTDQFGDQVDLWDFAVGRPTIVDITAMWCPYCQEMSAWLGPDGSDYYRWSWKDYDFYDEIPALVADGTIGWVTLISEGRDGGEPNAAGIEWWSEEYENPKIPILSDPEQKFMNWAEGTGYPTLLLLDADYRVADLSDTTRLLHDLSEEY